MIGITGIEGEVLEGGDGSEAYVIVFEEEGEGNILRGRS